MQGYSKKFLISSTGKREETDNITHGLGICARGRQRKTSIWEWDGKNEEGFETELFKGLSQQGALRKS